MGHIIHILCHTLNNDETLHYHTYGNFAARTAQNIIKHSSKYKCQVWCAVNNLDKKTEFKKGSIVYKLYPASTFNKLLESFYGIISCPQLLSDIGRLDPKKTVISFQGERSSLIHTILKTYPNYKYTLQYHGYGQPKWFNWVEDLFLVPIERQTFPFIAQFFVHIQGRIRYLKDKIQIPEEKISFQNVGVDFNKFKPLSKIKARKQLRLPQDAFIILYVGRMVKTKGIDKIVKAYQILKERHNHIYLMLIGGQKEDPMYAKAKDIADKVIETINNADLPLYYNASDVYCFYGNEKTIQYAGVGTAPTEALACNMNVVSTNLLHIPQYDTKRIGFVPRNFDDFVSQIEYLITHPHFKFNPRRNVALYTSFENMTKNLINSYEKLLS